MPFGSKNQIQTMMQKKREGTFDQSSRNKNLAPNANSYDSPTFVARSKVKDEKLIEQSDINKKHPSSDHEPKSFSLQGTKEINKKEEPNGLASQNCENPLTK